MKKKKVIEVEANVINDEEKKAEQKKEENEKEKIKFYKKVWWSIAKPSKYEEMCNESLPRAIMYFLVLLIFISIVFAIFATYLQQSKVIEPGIKKLESDLPELTFVNNELSLENEEAVILDANEIYSFLGYEVVLNPYIEKEEAIEEYSKIVKENQKKCTIFLNNKLVFIALNDENESGIETKEHTYEEYLSNYLIDTTKEYKKNDVIELKKQSISYEYYFGFYFTLYYISLIVFYAFYIITIAIAMFLVNKLLKLGSKIKEVFKMTVYIMTLPVILFAISTIISNSINFTLPYVEVINIGVSGVYFLIIFKNEKKKLMKK